MKETQVKAPQQKIISADLAPGVSTRPAAIEPPPKTKKTTIFAVIAMALLLLFGGAYFSRTALFASPEDVFYGALKNSMSLRYIGQKYTVESGNYSVVADSQTDFSDPANPKTQTRTTYSSDGNKSAEIETLTFKEYAEYGKFTYLNKASVSGSERGDKFLSVEGKWLQAKNKEEATLIDPLGITSNINMTQGEFLVGNYPAVVRDELLGQYKNTKVFTFDKKDIATETLNGKKVFRYKLKINIDALQAVNSKAEEMLKISRKYTIESPAAERVATVWIEKGTSRVVKTSSEFADQKTIVDITYPTTLNLTKPSGPISVSAAGLLPESSLSN